MPAADIRSVLRHGLLAGLLAGLIFSAAASAAALLMGRPWDAPLRVVGAVALGPGVLDTGQPFWPMLLWGMGLHLLYTAVTGVLFAWPVAAVPALRKHGVATVAAALVYTLLLWLSGFYLLAPLLGWWWFPMRTEFLSQLMLQVGVWGGALGGYFAWPRVRHALATRVPR